MSSASRPSAAARTGGVVHGPASGGELQDQVGGAVEVVVEELLSLRRLGSGIVEPAHLQAVGHAGAEDAGDDEEGEGDCEHRTRTADDRLGKASQPSAAALHSVASLTKCPIPSEPPCVPRSGAGSGRSSANSASGASLR